MNRLRALGQFIYDFVIGDDPLIAAAIVVALGFTAALGSDVPAWWILPVAVVLVLSVSLHRATRG
jgi:hypothetical protein